MKNLNIEKCIDLQSCIDWLLGVSKFHNIFHSELKLSEKEFINLTHHGVGTCLRNTLNLWGEGPVVEYFNKLGIYHADDMSCIILTSLWRTHNNLDIKLDTQIKTHIDYWDKVDPKVNNGFYKNDIIQEELIGDEDLMDDYDDELIKELNEDYDINLENFPKKKKKKQWYKVKCPLCKSLKKTYIRDTESNGIIGPGSASWVNDEYIVCMNCGIMYKDLSTIKI